MVSVVTARVVSSAALPIDAGALLPPGTTFRAPPTGSFERSALLGELDEADGLIALLDVRVDQELLDAAPRLRIAANVAVGVDNVDLLACRRRGVVVTNTPDVLTESTADFAFALMLAAARRVVEGDRLVRAGSWRGWSLDLLLGRDLSGATLGLIGLGRIGGAVARRGLGFGMKLVYAAPRPSAAAAALGARHLPVADLLDASDVVSLHCPLTPETRHLLDAAAFARMKPDAILINTARGGCVDEGALVAALAAGRPGGAGLDVFEAEPAIHPGLVADPRVVLAPHLGSATIATRARMATLAVESVADQLGGRRPRHVVGQA
jgi:glyoxylate reductase